MKTVFNIFLIALLPVIAFGQEDSILSLPQWPVGMTVDQFNLKLKTTTKPLLVNFTADWCVVCKRQKPVLDQVMTEVKDEAELLVIDMESNPLIAAYFEVDGLPVTILYKNGTMMWNRVGLQDKTQILGQLSPLVNKKVQKKNQ
jgi:thioredoxin 1